jgi:branched-chain amino acid transport system ATP-binding protein
VSALLALDAVSAGYGESVVVDGVTVAVEEGECVAVLGRNGVGKTTLLATIMGLARLHAGTVAWRGRDITRMAAHERARGGIGWVPQERGMWRTLDVEEHLSAVARPGDWDARKVFELFPRLADRQRHRGAQLSGGEQQMLAIARALVTNPQLLLFDEPLEGLAPLVVRELVTVLRSLAGRGGTAVILVEQHAQLALSIAQRAVVMDRGRIVLAESSAALSADRRELDRWLGVGAVA